MAHAALSDDTRAWLARHAPEFALDPYGSNGGGSGGDSVLCSRDDVDAPVPFLTIRTEQARDALPRETVALARQRPVLDAVRRPLPVSTPRASAVARSPAQALAGADTAQNLTWTSARRPAQALAGADTVQHFARAQPVRDARDWRALFWVALALALAAAALYAVWLYKK